MVVYVVTAGYLQVLAESARVDSAKVQVASAQAIFEQASDRFTAGLSAKIDMTRSQVELQTQQQRLTAEQAEYAKQKIALARLIGLSSGQDLILTDAMPYAPLENLTLEQAIALASHNRSDLKAAEAQMRAAELSRKAASAERYPTIDLGANYGVIGINPASSHGTFSVTGQLKFPIWEGGRVRGDIEQADATLSGAARNMKICAPGSKRTCGPPIWILTQPRTRSASRKAGVNSLKTNLFKQEIVLLPALPIPSRLCKRRKWCPARSRITSPV